MYFDELSYLYEWRREPKGILIYDKVYGGYVGTKISKDKPNSVWEWLKKMDITRIIDLRYDYKPEAFKSRCEEFGIRYFSYPVHDDPETIANMVENFNDFSDMIMDGHFYMMGHRRAYTALCLYWVFGNNSGLYPMEVRHSVATNADMMKKALPILNAFAKYKEEHLDEMLDRKGYADELQERIRDFKENSYPKKVWFEIFNFLRAFRNGSVVYDISVDGLGVVGYLYPSRDEYEEWEYDIIIYPYGTGKARSFADAQLMIARYLCENIHHSIKYPALPQSMKMAIGILQKIL